jgi:hypothetical protein
VFERVYEVRIDNGGILDIFQIEGYLDGHLVSNVVVQDHAF